MEEGAVRELRGREVHSRVSRRKIMKGGGVAAKCCFPDRPLHAPALAHLLKPCLDDCLCRVNPLGDLAAPVVCDAAAARYHLRIGTAGIGGGHPVSGSSIQDLKHATTEAAPRCWLYLPRPRARQKNGGRQAVWWPVRPGTAVPHGAPSAVGSRPGTTPQRRWAARLRQQRVVRAEWRRSMQLMLLWLRQHSKLTGPQEDRENLNSLLGIQIGIQNNHQGSPAQGSKKTGLQGVHPGCPERHVADVCNRGRQLLWGGQHSSSRAVKASAASPLTVVAEIERDNQANGALELCITCEPQRSFRRAVQA